MNRNIKEENEVIRDIMIEVIRQFRLEKCENTGHGYTDFMNYILIPIENRIYGFLDEDGIMGEFNKYLNQFWNTPSDEKKGYAIINKFVKNARKTITSINKIF